MRRKDLLGQKFGLLTVVDLSDKVAPATGRLWKCECECGNIAYVPSNRLTTGHTQSCGCLRASLLAQKRLASVEARYEPKTDCIMYRSEESMPYCDALTEMFCATKGKCSFYCTGECDAQN